MQKLMIQSPNGQSTATFIPEKGGLATSLKMADPLHPGKNRELLYLPADINLNTYNKLGVAWPFCFPICGRLNRSGESAYLHQHRLYKMDIHGFAHAQPWEVISHTHHSLTLQLRASAHSKKQYPFEFVVTLHYYFTNEGFYCQQTYHNPGTDSLPYSAGFHPYFWIDPACYRKSEIKLSCTPIKQLQYNSDLTDILGEKAPYALPKAIDDPEINESLLLLSNNHQVNLHFPDGSVITMTVTGDKDSSLFRYLQLYHIPSEPFFCIEPWMGHPNAMNTVNGARLLPPGHSDTALLVLQLTGTAKN